MTFDAPHPRNWQCRRGLVRIQENTAPFADLDSEVDTFSGSRARIEDSQLSPTLRREIPCFFTHHLLRGLGRNVTVDALIEVEPDASLICQPPQLSRKILACRLLTALVH